MTVVGPCIRTVEPMHKRALTLLLPIAASMPMLPAPASARTLEWSGHRWDVRPAGFGSPGPNQWSDAPENVRVEGSELVLTIRPDAAGQWAGAEVANQAHLGYGTYRWVVNSDLKRLDAHEVLGMFTYGGPDPSNNEIDFEPAHWGNRAWPGGSATVWQDAAAERRRTQSFRYAGRPPYVHEFVWRPGRIDYVVTEGGGATLLDWTVTSGVPTPSSEVARINYWRFRGMPPAGIRSMRLASFSWAPPAAGADTRVRIRPARFVIGAGRHAALRTHSGRTTAVRLRVQRSTGNGRFVTVATVARVVPAGTARLRFSGRIGGRRLPAGRYRVSVAARETGVRVVPRRLLFAVRR
jgi:hypothetical protein